ncbi:MAG: ferritin family protein [Candidatus Woesearchaeota archaeon]|nr:ferritin family protein [Candidatus Woesearchaeota archaeon]
MVKLWRCEICGDSFIADEPEICPFCGAHKGFVKEAKDAKADFDVELNEKEKANAEKALKLEISNSEFYFCAAEKTDNEEGKLLFNVLGRVEAEHVSIWRKILKLDKINLGKSQCSGSNIANLEESHNREEMAIKFYREAVKESENPFVRKIFGALVQVESDHLQLSEERLK